MSTSFHDQNNISTLIAIQNNGVDIKNVIADPTFHAINVSDGTAGNDNGPTESRHDSNNIPILMAVSSGDGKTPVAVYCNSSGAILIDSV